MVLFWNVQDAGHWTPANISTRRSRTIRYERILLESRIPFEGKQKLSHIALGRRLYQCGRERGDSAKLRAQPGRRFSSSLSAAGERARAHRGRPGESGRARLGSVLPIVVPAGSIPSRSQPGRMAVSDGRQPGVGRIARGNPPPSQRTSRGSCVPAMVQGHQHSQLHPALGMRVSRIHVWPPPHKPQLPSGRQLLRRVVVLRIRHLLRDADLRL